MTGSEDGVLRLWNSRDIYEAAAGLKEAPCSSQNSDSMLQGSNGRQCDPHALPQ